MDLPDPTDVEPSSFSGKAASRCFVRWLVSGLRC